VFSGFTTPQAYADAAFNVHDLSKSQLGYVITLAGGPITWKSVKTSSTALSSTEAEYMAISELGREIQALVNLYDALRLPLPTPITINEDNKGTISMCTSDVYTARSKHIQLRYHHIRELVKDNTVNISWIPTKFQIADTYTKGLPKFLFHAFRQAMSMRSWSQVNDDLPLWDPAYVNKVSAQDVTGFTV